MSRQTSIFNTDNGSESESTNSLHGYLDGMSLQKQDISVAVDGSDLCLDFEALDSGGNIEYHINGKKEVLDCLTGDGVGGKARVKLILGTATKPQVNIIYVAVDGNDSTLKLYSSLINPSSNYAYVCKVAVWDLAKTLLDGFPLIQRLTEAISHNGRSAVAWERENIRYGAATGRILSGADPFFEITTNSGSEDSIDLHLTEAIIFQLHRQQFSEYDISRDGVWVCNSTSNGSFNNYTKFFDLKDVVKELKDGTTLNDGDSISVYVWGAMNFGGNSKLFVNLAKGKYTVDADCVNDTNNYTDYKVPKFFKTVAFPVARICLKWNTLNNGTWSNLLTTPVTAWHSDTTTFYKTPNYPLDYDNSDDQTYTLTKSGAIAVRIHYVDFNTEANYDFESIRNATDPFPTNLGARRLDPKTYDGDLNSFTTHEEVGDTIRVNHITDGSVVRSGCHGYLEYKSTAQAGNEVDDKRGDMMEFIF